MIVKSGSGFKVKSEHGKNLSRTLPTRGAAEKRLAQVEYFKHHSGYTDPHHTHSFAMDPWKAGRCLMCGKPLSEHKY